MVYTSLNGLAPSYTAAMFKKTATVNKRVTRATENGQQQVPKENIETHTNSFAITRSKEWNMLNLNLRLP